MGCASATEDMMGFRTRLWCLSVTIAPFLAVTVVYLIARIWALRGFAHTITPLPLSSVLFTIPSVLLRYLRMIVWPRGLSCYYDTPYIRAPSLGGLGVSLLLLAGVAGALAFWFRKLRKDSRAQAKTVAFLAFWTVLAVMPVLNFRLLPEGEIVHDRYAYLPMVGFVILAALGLRQAGASLGRCFPRPIWGLTGMGALAVLMAIATARQSLYWSDDLTLYHRAHEVAPRNLSATTSLAAAAAERGMEGAAVALYRQALAVEPDFWRANVNLGYLLYARGDFAGAAPHFQRACAANPWDGDQFLYLGMSLLRLGRPGEAERAVRSALLVRPNGDSYHLGLGMVLLQEEKLIEAKQELESELARNPSCAQASALLAEVNRRLVTAAQGDNTMHSPMAGPRHVK